MKLLFFCLLRVFRYLPSMPSRCSLGVLLLIFHHLGERLGYEMTSAGKRLPECYSFCAWIFLAVLWQGECLRWAGQWGTGRGQ